MNRIGDSVPGFKAPVIKPTVYLTSKEIPDLKNWQPGNTYRVMLTLKQTSMSLGDDVGGNFEIVGAKALNNQPGGKPYNGKNRNKSAMMKALSKKAQQ